MANTEEKAALVGAALLLVNICNKLNQLFNRNFRTLRITNIQTTTDLRADIFFTLKEFVSPFCYGKIHVQCLPPNRYVLRFFGKFSKIVN